MTALPNPASRRPARNAFHGAHNEHPQISAAIQGGCWLTSHCSSGTGRSLRSRFCSVLNGDIVRGCGPMRGEVLYLAIASAATVVLHLTVRLPWGLAALASFVGWPVLGTLITIDDDLPGGWSNPDGKRRPDWLRARFWGNLFAGLAASAVVAGMDGDWVPWRLMLYGGGALVAASVSVVLRRRRPAEEPVESCGRDAGES